MTGDPHTLTGAYALDALDEVEETAFSRHLAGCASCAVEVRELRETATRLALAVAEVPPPRMRERVRATLDDVRQLPPRTPGLRARSARLRRWRDRLPYLAAAACLAIAAVAGGFAIAGQHDADQQRARGQQAERRAGDLAALLAAPDSTTRAARLKGGGTGTVVSSASLGRTAFVYRDLPRLSDSRVYQLWYSRGGTMVPAGLLTPGTTQGTAVLTGSPAGANGVGVTVEPSGGSKHPTSSPLAVLPLRG